MNLKAMTAGVLGALLPVLVVTALAASGPVGWGIGALCAVAGAGYAGYQCNKDGGSFWGSFGKGLVFGAGSILATAASALVAGAFLLELGLQGDGALLNGAVNILKGVGNLVQAIFNSTLWWMGSTGSSSVSSEKETHKKPQEEKQATKWQGTDYRLAKNHGVIVSQAMHAAPPDIKLSGGKTTDRSDAVKSPAPEAGKDQWVSSSRRGP